ncbi:MAG TPA: DMT family transporter [Puia sp.]|jgi:drug/metabolite transporter (DMT)-like permease|nr:DMT family transporter [Puia sp.]
MNFRPANRNVFIGILLAVLATLVWSGNFIVARGAFKLMPPVAMAFYRWGTATVVILPFGLKRVMEEKTVLVSNKSYLFWASLTGVTLFNTCVYVAGHYSPAINLALVGTTASPIIAVILARIFLKEKITALRVIGLAICICGILFLMGKGSFREIIMLRFSLGDLWILLGAFFFAVYNTLVRKKPAVISPLAFLTVIFTLGTLILFPLFIYEQSFSTPIQWNTNLILIVLYLGLGNSVISYMCWNAAIAKLGAARTALFGNLIPVFSSIEAAYILDERITGTLILSLVAVIFGLIIANFRSRNR